ncbi:MAG: hypothetical protein IKQ97_07480, partial [Eubacterium sp.]|nr:hypothetical protein [Eubacterium sp.]
MMTFVLNYIIAAVGVIVLGGAGYLTYRNFRRAEGQKKKPAVVFWVLGALCIAFALSFTIIPTGYTGVLSTFGQISVTTLPNGFNFRVPLAQEINLVNNKQQDMVFEDQQISFEHIPSGIDTMTVYVHQSELEV